VEAVRAAVRACAHIVVPDPAPAYLQPFLASRLQRTDPALAARVARLEPAACAELFRLIRDLQSAGRSV
jgi:hypothetical protein